MRIELARWQGAAPIGHGSFGAMNGSIDSIDIGQRQAHLPSSHTRFKRELTTRYLEGIISTRRGELEMKEGEHGRSRSFYKESSIAQWIDLDYISSPLSLLVHFRSPQEQTATPDEDPIPRKA